MAKKRSTKTGTDGIRRYTCRHCGKAVEIGRTKWRKLKQEDKRLCPACAERKNRPPEPHYCGYGPYNFGFI